MKKNYNYTRRKLYLPEYGRHIQEMIDSLLEIEDRRERNRLYDIYATGISQLGLRLLHSRIPVRAALGRDLVPGTWAGRSTLLPPDAALARECGLADLMNELCLALNLDPKDEGRNG